MMGRPPTRVDLIASIDGVGFDEAWSARRTWRLDEGLLVPVIGLDALIRNKRAAGRPQDLVDAAVLEAARDG